MVADSSAVEHDSAISRVPSVLPQIFERRDYFTVGSTKEEVLAVQGTPSEFTDSTFTYGYSRVHFRGDRVTTWEDRQTNPLRVKLLPTAGIERKTYFTVGSTKDEVLAVQGTPTEFTDSTFTYGYSEVHFRDDRVTTWEDRPTNPLHVKLLPAAGVEHKAYFTIGSTKDQVLAVQGTPSEFTDSTFTYGYSRDHLRGDRVTTWEVSRTNPLRVQRSK